MQCVERATKGFYLTKVRTKQKQKSATKGKFMENYTFIPQIQTTPSHQCFYMTFPVNHRIKNKTKHFTGMTRTKIHLLPRRNEQVPIIQFIFFKATYLPIYWLTTNGNHRNKLIRKKTATMLRIFFNYCP